MLNNHTFLARVTEGVSEIYSNVTFPKIIFGILRKGSAITRRHGSTVNDFTEVGVGLPWCRRPRSDFKNQFLGGIRDALMGTPNDALVGERRIHLSVVREAFAEGIRQRAPDFRGALLEPMNELPIQICSTMIVLEVARSLKIRN